MKDTFYETAKGLESDRNTLNRPYPKNDGLVGGLTGMHSEPTISKETEEGEIIQETKSAHMSIEQLHKLISVLSNKLSPILCENFPMEGGNNKNPERSSSLGQELSLVNNNIESAIDNIKYIINRIQL